jgi:PKHD-type hydroxylase
MLLTIPDVLTPDEVAQARKLLQTAPWADGKPGAGEQARQVKNNEQLPHDCMAARAIRAMALAGLDRCPAFFSATLPKRIFPPRLNRYSGASNHYGNHIDGAVRYVPAGLGDGMPNAGQRVRTDVSCTLFLSDPETYDGGELCMQDTFGEQAVKLPAGHLVIYPGTSLHQVRPVTRGERLACFFWIESMVRSSEQRRLLYEFDMALLALRQQHGDTPETTALTGSYHNLLRMWADT